MQNSVLSPNVRINSYSEVHDSILMENVDIGRHCRIRRAIIDKDVVIPPETEIGYNREEDRKRYHVTTFGHRGYREGNGSIGNENGCVDCGRKEVILTRMAIPKKR